MPPEAVTGIAPSEVLAQDASEIPSSLIVSCEGSVIVTVTVAVHEFASVIVAVYVPAAKPVSVVAVPPLVQE